MPNIAGMDTSAINRAIEFLGSASALGRALGVTPTTVSEWKSGERDVPLERCAEIERATDGRVKCEELRPDKVEFFAYLRSTPTEPRTEAA